MKNELMNELALMIAMLAEPMKMNEDVTAECDADDENASEFSFKNKQMCFASMRPENIRFFDETCTTDADIIHEIKNGDDAKNHMFLEAHKSSRSKTPERFTIMENRYSKSLLNKMIEGTELKLKFFTINI